MSQSRVRCSNCPGRHFPTLLEAVKHVMSERGMSRQVQCCVEGCSKRVQARKFRRHIRKFHKELCPWSCSACPEKFVERRDLNNHQRNGCHSRKLGSISFPKQPLRVIVPCVHVTSLASAFLGLKSKEDAIGKHKAM